MALLHFLFFFVLKIQLLAWCQGDEINWKRIDDNKEIYPWLVQIKETIKHTSSDRVFYGALISHNAVITARRNIKYDHLHRLKVESYCPKLNDKITSDCFVSDVERIISESTREALLKSEDPYAILILKNSFNGSYVRPLSIADSGKFDADNCFLPIWPSDNPSDFSTRIDLHRTAHKVKISFGSHLISTLDRNVINALSKEPYLDLLRFYSSYSDNDIPQLSGIPLVCPLKNDPSQVALVGPLPGYFLKSCNRGEFDDCRSIIYYIDLTLNPDDVINKLNS